MHTRECLVRGGVTWSLAVVRDETVYAANSNHAHVWEVSSCRQCNASPASSESSNTKLYQRQCRKRSGVYMILACIVIPACSKQLTDGNRRSISVYICSNLDCKLTKIYSSSLSFDLVLFAVPTVSPVSVFLSIFVQPFPFQVLHLASSQLQTHSVHTQCTSLHSQSPYWLWSTLYRVFARSVLRWTQAPRLWAAIPCHINWTELVLAMLFFVMPVRDGVTRYASTWRTVQRLFQVATRRRSGAQMPAAALKPVKAFSPCARTVTRK